ncbi:hypothetical protein Pcinc_021101 [Petrolisthes cinctipes]|uniref:Uncharacterized protein n=1 Tax=Petrolisthes cinctipes TaxID=88211 RepID=A0AAE1KIV8_PETCI|nr:hypothetical protein Pcinc_021101 [Petrolisthes cinctipes]KAK3873923.1 hypothetical protein Pcinc_021101 [Petrolisthes cinctipes]
MAPVSSHHTPTPQSGEPVHYSLSTSCPVYSEHLLIVNGNFAIPSNDGKYDCFHEFIRGTLRVDPSQRFKVWDILERLAAVTETKGVNTKDVFIKPQHTSYQGVNTKDVFIKPQHKSYQGVNTKDVFIKPQHKSYQGVNTKDVFIKPQHKSYQAQDSLGQHYSAQPSLGQHYLAQPNIGSVQHYVTGDGRQHHPPLD